MSRRDFNSMSNKNIKIKIGLEIYIYPNTDSICFLKLKVKSTQIFWEELVKKIKIF